MKKIYSFLLFLAVAAVASAQTLSVTVNGKTLVNGQTHTEKYASAKTDMHDLNPAIPAGMAFKNGLYPEVMISSATGQNVAVTLTNKSQNEVVGFCYGGQCDNLTAANSYTLTKTAFLQATTPFNMQIEANKELLSPTAYELEVKCHADNGEDFNFTLVLDYNPIYAGVESAKVAAAAADCYTISGVKTVKPIKGLNIRGGRKFVVK